MAGNKPSKKTKLVDEEEVSKLDAKKKKKNLEPVEVADQFDPDVLLDVKNDICAMCKGNHEVGLRLKEKIIVRSIDEDEPDEIRVVDPRSILDVNGVWASKYSILRKSQRLFVHYYCAINSPQVIFCGKSWSNLAKEVNRGRSLVCRYCGLNGATLGCFDARCHVVMHVPCAVKLGFRRSGFKLSFLCEDHTKSYLEKELALDEQVRDDLSKGKEPVPVTSVNRLDSALASKEMEYTKVNLDSTDVAMNASSVHEMDCCMCDGLCDDVAQCACLSLGRNYTFTGGLIPGAKKRVLECNLRCGCSIRRCTNRVVEKGPTYRLEVFRVPVIGTSGSATSSNSNSSAAKKYTWGVRTLDFIPENAFICEVTGQYTFGRSKSSSGDDSTSAAVESKTDPLTISQLMLADPASAANNAAFPAVPPLAYSTKVVPVRAWLEGEHTNKEIFDPLSPALWAAEQQRQKHIKQSQQALLAHSGDDSQDDDDCIDLTGGASGPVAGAGAYHVPTVREILVNDREAVRQFLDGELCVDSRQFGNVGSLIRRKPATRASSGSSSSAPSVSAPIAGTDGGRMLHRRIVFTNKRNPNSAPKLALFAARNIEANTELFI